MRDNISELYKALQDTYELGSEDDFRDYLNDGDNREALRKELEAEWEVGDSTSFARYLGIEDNANLNKHNANAEVEEKVGDNDNVKPNAKPWEAKVAGVPSLYDIADKQREEAPKMPNYRHEVSVDEEGGKISKPVVKMSAIGNTPQVAPVFKDYAGNEYDATDSKVLEEAKRQVTPIVNTPKAQEEPSLLESIGKSIGAGAVRAGTQMIDVLQQLSSNMYVEDPSSPTGFTRTQSYEEQIKDENNPLTQASSAGHTLADKWSKEAQPRQGKGFVDLIMDGDITGALQKGVATAGESLPTTLSWATPYTAILNAIGMAGGNYREYTLEDESIPAWKRASMAIGSAAFEQAVEKYADPVFKYIGGTKILKGAAKEASKEIVEEVTKNATETLAKRIYKGLTNVGKDALGEGAEEVVTTFGNDALGEVLDYVEGSTDYGVRAQWEKLKKENPNANLWDFSKQKAKEYGDSFIGGYLSGAYTSGTAQVTTKALQYATGAASEIDIEGKRGTKILPPVMDVAQAFDNGYSLEGQEMNDAMNMYDMQREKAVQVLGDDKVAELDANPVDAMAGIDTEEQLQVATDYVNAKATFDGMGQKVLDDINAQIADSEKNLNELTSKTDGKIHPVTLKGERKAHIVDGNLAVTDNGEIDAANSDLSILVRDDETGKIEFVSPSDIVTSDGAMDAEEEKANVAQAIRDAVTQQADAQMNGILSFNVGDEYDVLDDEGNAHTIAVVDNGQEGQVLVSVDGENVARMMPREEVQKMANNANLARLAEHEAKKEAKKQMENGETSGEADNKNVGANEPLAATPDAMPMIKNSEDPDFLATTPERGHRYLYDEAGIPKAAADNMVTAHINAAEKEVKKQSDALAKLDANPGTSISAYKAKQADINGKLDAAQAAYDYWNGVKTEQGKRDEAERQAAFAVQTADASGRQNELAAQKTPKEKIDAAKQMYGKHFDSDFTVPYDAMELVAMNMPNEKISWEGREGVRGLQQELGSNFKRGVGRDKGTNAFNIYLAKKGEGISTDEAIHSIYDSAENTLPNGEHRWDIEEIRGAFIDMFMGAEKPSDIRDYVLNNRIRQAEQMRAAEDEAAEMARLDDEIMRRTGMEREEYAAWIAELEARADAQAAYENEVYNETNTSNDRETEGSIGEEGSGQVQGQEGDTTGVEEDGAAGVAEGGINEGTQGDTTERHEGDLAQAKVSMSQESDQVAEEQKPTEQRVGYLDPRTMSEEEKERRGNMLRDTEVMEVAKEQIVSRKGISARKAAENWWTKYVGAPRLYETEIGEVVINLTSIDDSLAHGYSQRKLDSITSLPNGFKNAVYLGTMEDSDRRATFNHYFAYPISYDGKRCYVFCRALHDNNTNRLYVHEVYVEDAIKKGNTLQTAASKPHGGIALYRDILANVLDISEGKGTENSKTDKENEQKFNKGERYLLASGAVITIEDVDDKGERTFTWKSINNDNVHTSKATIEELEVMGARPLESVQKEEGQNESTINGAVDKAEKAKPKETASIKEVVHNYVQAYRNWADDIKNDAALKAWQNARKELEGRLNELSDEELEGLKSQLGGDFANIADFVGDISRRRTQNRELSNAFDEGMKAQKEISGTAKAPKVVLENFTANDELRPVLNGVHHDEDGFAVATNGMILIADKRQYDEANKGKTIISHKVGNSAKKGDIVDFRFPNWKMVVKAHPNGSTASVTFDGLRKFLAGAGEVMKSRWNTEKENGNTKQSFASWSSEANIAIRMPNGEVCVYKYDRLSKFADAAANMGMTDIYYAADKALVAANENGYVLLMPTIPNILTEEESLSYDAGRRFFYEWNSSSADRLHSKPNEQGKTETEKPQKSEKKSSARASSVVKIDDFGEKIGGARKDLARGRIRDIKGYTTKDLTTLKKGADDILSQANILRLYKDGQMDEQTARGFLAMNNAVKVAIKKYGRTAKEIILNKYRDAAVAWEEGRAAEFGITEADVAAYMAGFDITEEKARKDLDYCITETFDMYMLTYQAMNYPAVERKLGQYVIVDYGSMRSGRVPLSRPFWVKTSYTSGRGYPFATLEGAMEKLNQLCPEVKPKDTEKKEKGEKAEHGLRVTKEGFGFYVKSRNIPGNIYLSPKFTSEKQAQAYMEENLEQLKAREQRLVDALMGSNIGMAEREGVDYRNGKDVTPQDFLDEFGFRGVEFGNWVPQGERQMYLNKTYDAIKDFCAIVGISPKAFSLGGRLGLAFGARGSGRALAHYEPGKEAINLTRMSGVGSLAHEWFHALDNILAKQETGNTSDMATMRNDVVREEVSAVLKEMYRVMKAMDYDMRSRRAGEYWGRTEEEFARLFENYIYNKLAEKEVTSPILVRKDILFDDAEEVSKNRWPYPSVAENATMAPLFDKLFSTIQEKTDEKGNVVLFQKLDGSTLSKEADATEMMMRDALIETMEGAGIEVVTDVAIGQQVLDDANATREMRVYHGSGADFDAFDHSHMGEGEGAQAYGWGTYVTEVEGIGKTYAQSVGQNPIGRRPVLYKGESYDAVNTDGWSDEKKGVYVDLVQGMRVMGKSAEQAKDDLRLMTEVNIRNRERSLANLKVSSNTYQSIAEDKRKQEERLKHINEFNADDFTREGSTPTLYTVEIPEENAAYYIGYNERMREQQDIVEMADNELAAQGWRRQEIGEQMVFTNSEGKRIVFTPNQTGADFYEEFVVALGSKKAASEFLSSVGITGIKYPAEFRSGGRADGASNYVIFDESNIEITNKARLFRTSNGEVYGYTMGGKIYLDTRIATTETPIHEYSHLWSEALEQANPKAWEQLKNDLVKDTELMDYVKGLYPEIEDENELMHEVFAHFSGKRGRARLEEMRKEETEKANGLLDKARIIAMFNRLKELLGRYWTMARDLFAGSVKGLDKMKAEDFADMAMADLLGGFNPSAAAKNNDIRYQFVGEKSTTQEITEHINEIPKKYNLKGASIHQVISSREEMEGLRGILSDEAYTILEREYNTPNVKGVYLPEFALAIVFAEKAEGTKQGELTYIHEQVHAFYHSLPNDMRNRYGVACFDWLWRKAPEVYQKILRLYPESEQVRLNEACSFFIQELVNRLGIEKFLTGTPLGDDFLCNFITEFKKYIRNEQKDREDLRVGRGVQDAETSRNGERLYNDNLVGRHYGSEGGRDGERGIAEGGKLYRDSMFREGGVLPTYEESLASSKAAGYTKKQHDAWWNRAHKNMRLRANDIAKKLHLEGVVDIYETADDLNGVKGITKEDKKSKGWYDPKTGRIAIILGNHASAYDVMKTMLHEGVAHFGLRQLFGKNFETFLWNVYSNATPEVRSEINKLMAKNGWNYETATEEYLAGLAEDIDFDRVMKSGWWWKIKDWFVKMLRDIGLGSYVPEGKISDNELRYVLWRSYYNLELGGAYGTLLGAAIDVAKQYELGVGKFAPKEEVLGVAEQTERTTGVWAEKAEETTDEQRKKYVQNAIKNYPNTIGVFKGTDGLYHSTSDNMEPFSPDKLDEVLKKLIKSGTRVALIDDIPSSEDGVSESEYLGYKPTLDDYYKYTNATFELIARQYDMPAKTKVISHERTQEELALLKAEWDKLKHEHPEWEWHLSPKSSSEYLIDKETGDIYRYSDHWGKVATCHWVLKGSHGVAEQIIAKANIKDFDRNISEGLWKYARLHRSGDGTPRAMARDTYERLVMSGTQQFREAVQDSMLSLKNLYKSILQAEGKEKHIKDVAGYENAYLAENRMHSASQAQISAWTHDFFTPIVEEVYRLVGDGKSAYEELNDYLMAKHGLERNIVLAERDARKEYDRLVKAGQPADLNSLIKEYREKDYSGLTALTGEKNTADAELLAQQMVDDFEAIHDTTELWARINAATKSSLEKMFRSGLMSKARYEDIRDMFAYYIPLQGFDEKVAEDMYAYVGSDGTRMYGTPIRSARGRRSKADNPLATIAMNGEAAIRQGNRNEMKQHFLNFVQAHPSDLVSVSDVWLRYNDVTDEWEQYFDAGLKDDDSPEEVERKVRDFNERMEQLAASDPDRYKRGRDAEDIPFRVVSMSNASQHQVIVKRGGKTIVLTINGNPRAAQALNGLTNPDVFTDGVFGKAMNLGQNLNRLLSSLYTTRNPEFVASNYTRDALYSNCMTWVKESPAYAVRFHKNFGMANPAFMAKMFVEWENGELRKKVAQMGNTPKQGSVDYMRKQFYDFMMNGGETGWTSLRDIEAHKKDLEASLKKEGSTSRKAWKALGGTLDIANRAVENCARFSAFVTSREMGRSLERSIYDAKEVSVNFNKKGAGDKFLSAKGQTKLGKTGSVIGGLGRGLYVFFNAGVQGMANYMGAAKQNPAKLAVLSSLLFGLGSIIPIVTAIACGGDDDDEDSYYNLPEYVRRSNICFRWRKDMPWIKIPLPIEFRAMYGLGELSCGVLTGKERYSDEELAKQYISQISQVLPLDFMEGGGGWHAFVPSSVKPGVEAYTNKGWTGLPIYKDNKFKEYYPQWTSAYESADKTIVEATRWLNEATGGSDVSQGMIDWNPARIEYMLKGYLGGYYTMFDRLKKSAETAFGKREFEWRNVPIASRFVQEGDERTEARKAKSEYFDLHDEYEKTKSDMAGFKKIAESGRDDAQEYAKRLSDLENSQRYVHFQIMENYKPILDAYNAMIKEAEGEYKEELKAEQDALRRELIELIHAVDDEKEVNIEEQIKGDLDVLSQSEHKEIKKAVGSVVAKQLGGKYRSSTTEYGKAYEEIRNLEDLAEDLQMQIAIGEAEDSDDVQRNRSLEKARRDINKLKKRLGDPDEDDEKTMRDIRERRRDALKEFGKKSKE